MTDEELVGRAAFDAMGAVDVRPGLAVVNAQGVIERIVSWRRKPKPLSQRLLSAVIGRERQLDILFEAQAASALSNLYLMANDIREHVAESDIALARTAAKLREVSMVTIRKQLPDEVGRIEAMVVQVTQDLERLGGRVQKLEAQAAVDRMIVKIRSTARVEQLTVVHLWEAVDSLWWSEFGLLLRASPSQARSLELRRYMLGRLHEELREVGFGGPLLMAEALHRIKAATDDAKPAVELLALDPDWETRPITKAIVTRRLGEPAGNKEVATVPRVTTPERLVERLLLESERATQP